MALNEREDTADLVEITALLGVATRVGASEIWLPAQLPIELPIAQTYLGGRIAEPRGGGQ